MKPNKFIPWTIVSTSFPWPDFHRRQPNLCPALLAASLGMSVSCWAAPVTWQSPLTVTSDSNISLNGVLAHAGNFRTAGDFIVTVGAENILFENRPAQNATGTLGVGEEARVIQGAGGKQTNTALFNVTGTSVSANFDSVLDGSAWENGDAGPAPGLTDMILRVTGADGTALVAGQSYQIQLFYSDDRASSATRGQIFHDGLGNASASFLASSSSQVIGTFTADATGYQDFYAQNTTGEANFPVGFNAYVLRAISNEDTDGDGLPNLWETAHSLNPADATGVNGAAGDPDADTYGNLAEYQAGSDPQLAASIPGDIDGDELPDSWENSHFGNLSQTAFDDPDLDFAFNSDEYAAGTDPTNRLDVPDDDGPGGAGDGMGDAWELFYFGDTSRTGTGDYDSDGVTDLAEWVNNSDPIDPLDPFYGTAAVTWGAPVTTTADSDLTGGGTLVHAGNFRSDNQDVSVTVGSETILFKNRQTQDGAGELLEGEEARVVAGAGGRQVNADLFNATGTTVSPEFEMMLDGSAWENGDAGPAPGATDMVLRVTGAGGAALVAGQQYRIQLFYSDDRAGSATRGQLYLDGMGHSSAAFLASSSSYVIGTFTAAAVGYQDIFVRNTTGEGNFPVGINGYVLRTVSAGDSDGDGMPDAWETANGLNPSVNDASADPDGDGLNNLQEFAFGGKPNDGSKRGTNLAVLQDTNSNGQKELTLTISVLAGANFSAGANGTQVATVGGISYTVRGSLNLAQFTGEVVHTGSTAAADPAYELHTFRLTASEGLPNKGFLQAQASAAP